MERHEHILFLCPSTNLLIHPRHNWPRCQIASKPSPAQRQLAWQSLLLLHQRLILQTPARQPSARRPFYVGHRHV